MNGENNNSNIFHKGCLPISRPPCNYFPAIKRVRVRLFHGCLQKLVRQYTMSSVILTSKIWYCILIEYENILFMTNDLKNKK